MDARLLLGLGALVTLAGPHAAPSRCTPIHRQWLRADSAGHAIVSLRADSALVALWKPDSGREPPVADSARERRRRLWLGGGEPVYGQWATVERATHLPRGSRVLVVSWGLGSLCDPIPTGRAHVAPSGTRLFIEVPTRRDSGVVAGATILEVKLFTSTFFPSGRNLPPGVTPLTVDEYERLHLALPTHSEWQRNPERAAEQIRGFLRSNESLAQRYPALYFPEEVEQALSWEKERRARKP